MGGGYNTWAKYFYEFITRYKRNKSEKHKAKLKQLAKRDKEIAEELKPIQEQLKLLRKKEHKLDMESVNISMIIFIDTEEINLRNIKQNLSDWLNEIMK